MVEIGIVTSITGATATVEFVHLETIANCAVLQMSTGYRTIAGFPSVGTQVACWLGDSCNLVLGAVFSVQDLATAQTDFTVEVDGLVKISNASTSLYAILNAIYDTMKNIVVTGSAGPCRPDPATTAAIEAKKQQIKMLLK